ncbi:hypothetical protein D3C72_257440 [compost metagenome]
MTKGLHILRQRVRHDEREIRLSRPLIPLELAKPTVAPSLGPLGLPKNNAADLARPVEHAVQDVAAKLPLPHRFDLIEGEFRAQGIFEHQFLSLALKLLRPLLRLLLQLFDLLLHRRNLRVALFDLERKPLFRLKLSRCPNRLQPLVDLTLHREIRLPQLIVELPLLLEHLSLDRLRRLELFLPRLQRFGQFGELPVPRFDIGRDHALGPLNLIHRNLLARLVHALGERRLDIEPLLFDALLRRCDLSLRLRDKLVFRRQLLGKGFARLLDQGAGQGLGELDVGLAARARDGRFGHAALHVGACFIQRRING